MRSYEAARGLFSFLGFLAWCMIVGGGLFAFAAASIAGQMRGFGGPPTGLAVIMAMMPGLAIAFIGVVNLAIVQNGRAAVDTAEYSQQMLKVARDTLEVSRQSLQKADDLRQGFESLRVREPEPARVSFEELRSARTKAERETPGASVAAAPEQITSVPPVEPVEMPAPEAVPAIEMAAPIVVAEASAPEPEPVREIVPEPPATRQRAPLHEVKWLSDTRLEYRGATVDVQDGHYVWDGLSFADESSAKQYIDDRYGARRSVRPLSGPDPMRHAMSQLSCISTPIRTPNPYGGHVWGNIAAHCRTWRRRTVGFRGATSLPFGRDPSLHPRSPAV